MKVLTVFGTRPEAIKLALVTKGVPEDEGFETVVRGAAGRLVLLYLPTYSPRFDPIEMLWRHFRREIIHCELFEPITALVTAAQEFFTRYNQYPERVLSIIGAIPKGVTSRPL